MENFSLKKLWERKNTWLKNSIYFENTKSTDFFGNSTWKPIFRKSDKRFEIVVEREMRCPCNENSSKCCRIGVYSLFGVTILLTVKCW